MYQEDHQLAEYKSVPQGSSHWRTYSLLEVPPGEAPKEQVGQGPEGGRDGIQEEGRVRGQIPAENLCKYSEDVSLLVS